MNKKIKALSWTNDELRVISKHAGKLPVSEIVTLVNKVSSVNRTEFAVLGAGRRHHFDFKVVAWIYKA